VIGFDEETYFSDYIAAYFYEANQSFVNSAEVKSLKVSKEEISFIQKMQ